MSKKATHAMVLRKMKAPEAPYLPHDPKHIRPKIGLIGCGDITLNHLRAYRRAGYHVVALRDVVVAQASLVFDAFTQYGPLDLTCLVGTKGALSSVGPNFMQQKVTLHTARGSGSPKLRGGWVPDGFHGTMAELLCAIEEQRDPHNSARQNLDSLVLCFAAVASAEQGRPMVPDRVRRLPEHA